LVGPAAFGFFFGEETSNFSGFSRFRADCLDGVVFVVSFFEVLFLVRFCAPSWSSLSSPSILGRELPFKVVVSAEIVFFGGVVVPSPFACVAMFTPRCKNIPMPLCFGSGLIGFLFIALVLKQLFLTRNPRNARVF
jgi:hypothetical protein